MKEYLRDGVYVDYDTERDAIVLTAENGIEIQHRIYIEPDTWKLLKGFVERAGVAGTPNKHGEKLCPDCHHPLVNNLHGFDQNDWTIDDAERLIYLGACTYCKVCNPALGKRRGEQ